MCAARYDRAGMASRLDALKGKYAEAMRGRMVPSAKAMVDTLDNAEEGLPRLLDVDDTLVDAVKKKLMSFIKQRLHIKK